MPLNRENGLEDREWGLRGLPGVGTRTPRQSELEETRRKKFICIRSFVPGIFKPIILF